MGRRRADSTGYADQDLRGAMANVKNMVIGGLVLGAVALAVVVRFSADETTGPRVRDQSAVASPVPAVPEPAAIPVPEVETEIWRSQRLMRDLGFYDGPVNGELTPATTEAAVRFQTSRGVPADGKIDHMFIILLEDARRP